MENLQSNCHFASLFILLLSGLVHAAEFFLVPEKYNNLIYFNENNSRAWYSLYNSKARKLFHLCQSLLAGITICLLVIRPLSFTFKLLFILLTLSYLYSYTQRKTGRDGADQVRMLAFLAFSLCFFIHYKYSGTLPLLFLGIQLLIAYTTSGMAKLLSPHWRKGNVLADILNTHSFGNKEIARLLKNNPVLEKAVSHSAIFFMLLVPVSFALPHPGLLIISLSCMFCFHLCVAYSMKLNDFLVTMPLMYPALFFLHNWLYKLIL